MALVIVCLAWLLSGCGENSAPVPPPTATWTATIAPSPTATTPLTPRPTSTPYPTATPPPLSGRVRTRLLVECEVGIYGLRVRVLYGATILDTADPAATITRIRVYRDGVLLEDSGPLSHRIYVRQIYFEGRSRNVHTVQLHVTTFAAPQPADLLQFTQCPPAADEPLA